MNPDIAPSPPLDDSVEQYAAELAAALRGPAGARERLVVEVRDGLAETVAAYEAAGVPAERAVREAVAEFGSVAEVAASCQRELTVAQARHTARALALTGPFQVREVGAPLALVSDDGYSTGFESRLLGGDDRAFFCESDSAIS